MTPLGKMMRLMETVDLDERPDILKKLTLLYGRRSDEAIRSARYRDRKRDASRDAIRDASRDGNRDASQLAQCISPVVSEVVRSEGTETTKETAKLERQERTRTAVRLIDFLNEKAGRSFRKSRVNLDLISARLSDGISEQDCRGVIARKCREWKGTEYAKYLRPETLFNRTKLESYLGEREPEVPHGPVS